MAMKLQLRAAMIVAFMTAVVAWSNARATDEVPLVTGQHWTTASVEQKKAYLIGIANLIEVDATYHAGNPPADAQSVVPRMAKGLKGQTLDSAREALDRWYAGHPDRIGRPVIETIWFELVVPGLRMNK
jgi:hypothetical protein